MKRVCWDPLPILLPTTISEQQQQQGASWTLGPRSGCSSCSKSSAWGRFSLLGMLPCTFCW